MPVNTPGICCTVVLVRSFSLAIALSIYRSELTHPNVADAITDVVVPDFLVTLFRGSPLLLDVWLRDQHLRNARPEEGRAHVAAQIVCEVSCIEDTFVTTEAWCFARSESSYSPCLELRSVLFRQKQGRVRPRTFRKERTDQAQG
jgi:hypothetical protein